MSAKVSIQLKRIDSIYENSGSPVQVKVFTNEGHTATEIIPVTNMILEMGEPFLVRSYIDATNIEHKDLLFIGDGVWQTSGEGEIVSTKLVGTTIQELIDNHLYFEKVTAPCLYKDEAGNLPRVESTPDRDADKFAIADLEYVTRGLGDYKDVRFGADLPTSFASTDQSPILFLQVINGTPIKVKPYLFVNLYTGSWMQYDIFANATLTGVPTAPTASTSTDTNQIATTKFTWNAIKTLDVSNQTCSASKTVNVLSETDGKISVTFQNIAITHDQITDWNDATSAVLDPLDLAKLSLEQGETLKYIQQTNGKVTAEKQDIKITYDQITDGTAKKPIVSSATPLIDGGWTGSKYNYPNGNVGTSTKYSREDHVHPTDTSRAAVIAPELQKASNGTYPKSPTVSDKNDSSTNIANTAFVHDVVDHVLQLIYYQATCPDIANDPALTPAEKQMARIWVKSTDDATGAKGMMMIWTGSEWKHVYSVWGIPD